MKMKFKDYTFLSNPSKLEIAASTNVRSKPIFGKSSSVSNVSVNPIIVKGSGEFYGDGAEEGCYYLQHLLRCKCSGILLLPSSGSLTAYLTEFSFSRDACKGGVLYSFTFTEDCSDKEESRRFHYTVAADGENAFDIAGRCGVSVSVIMAKNSFKTPFSINSGDRVVLR